MDASPRSLYVLRHGKAEEAAPGGGGDRGRVLKRRGRRDSKRAGRYLARLGEAPELVLSSDAARARETAELALAAGAFGARLELRPGIYDASAEQLLAELRAAAASARRVLLVGHQPGLAQLIGALTGSEPDFPTAALARVDVDVARWSELAPRTGRLVWLVTAEVLDALRPKVEE